MKKLIILSVICFYALNIHAQWLSKNPTNITPNSNLASVYFTGPNTGYVVGSNGGVGLLLKTTDGGDTWSNHSIAANYSFTSVYFTHPDTGYVAGAIDSCIVLKTTDAGVTWNPLPVPKNTFSFYNIHFTDAMTGFVSGIHGTIYKTTDAGATWTGVFGSSWGLGSVHGMSFVNDSTGYVFGDHAYGGIKKTSNTGGNWTVQNHPTTAALRSSHFINSSTGWVVGDTGTILKTTDGGTNWIQQTSNTTERLKDVFFIDALNGVVVGENGMILKTTDGGTHWYFQTSNTNETLNAVHFFDTNTGYATGTKRTLRKTTNGGNFPTYVNDYAEKNIKLNAYPNPTNGFLDVTTNAKISNIQLEDLLGKILYSKKVESTHTKLDLTGLPSNVYLLIVNTDKGKVWRKITIEH